MSERTSVPQMLRDAADLVDAGEITPAAAAAAAAALLPQPVQTTPVQRTPRSRPGASASTSRTSSDTSPRTSMESNAGHQTSGRRSGSHVEVNGLFARIPQASFTGVVTPRQGQFPPLTMAIQPPPRKKSRYSHMFICLSDHRTDKVPSKFERLELTTSGLGEKRISFYGEDNDPLSFRNELEAAFPPLRETGGFELLRITGATRSRELCVIQCPDEGYSTQFLRNPATGIGQATLYVRPLQKSIDLESRDRTSTPYAGPLTRCIWCDKEIAFNRMRMHNAECLRSPDAQVVNLDSDDEEVMPSTSGSHFASSRSTFGLSTRSQSTTAVQPVSMESTSPVILPVTSASTPLGSPQNTPAAVLPALSAPGPSTPGPSASETPGPSASPGLIGSRPSTSVPSGSRHSGSFVEELFSPEWKLEPDFRKAADLYKSWLLADSQHQRLMILRMDLRDEVHEREASLLSTYKSFKENWARPIKCILQGDLAFGQGVTRFFFSKSISLLQNGFKLQLGNTPITKLFEGLIENDMFFIAGRMMGHAFIHGGPSLTGMSPAIVHVLFGGAAETATVELEDCAEYDIRSTIELLEGEAELSEQELEQVNQLAISWDIDPFTPTRRRWLYERLLLAAVIRRSSRQVRQLKKGLKDTQVWALFTERPETIPLLFPRGPNAPSSEFILERIVWPVLDEDDYDDECSLDDTCRVAGYLCDYIEKASPDQLRELLKFWTGWEMISLGVDLTVQVVSGVLPMSWTCFGTLKLPAHYVKYEDFVHDLEAWVSTTDTGFGMA